jgi:hypothetical protein
MGIFGEVFLSSAVAGGGGISLQGSLALKGATED